MIVVNMFFGYYNSFMCRIVFRYLRVFCVFFLNVYCGIGIVLLIIFVDFGVRRFGGLFLFFYYIVVLKN